MEKKTKPKGDTRIEAETKAKEFWERDPNLSIETVAKEVSFHFDLTETVGTVKNWIRPFDPLIGTGIKRKRQAKKKN